MARRSILETSKAIFDLLQQEHALSTRQISAKVGVDWRTALKALNFLIYVGAAKETKGKKTYKQERLYSKIRCLK